MTNETGGLVATAVHGLLLMASLLVFPAVAIVLWRKHQAKGLLTAVAAAILIIGVVAAALASELLGNRLSGTAGFAYVASRTVIVYEFTLGLPILVSAIVIRLLNPVRQFILPYAIAVLVTVIANVVAAIGAAYLMPLLN